MNHSSVTQLDRAFSFLMAQTIATGFTPHYTALARQFSIQPEAAKELLHELMKTGIPGFLYPETDYIASLAPFSNQATHYEIRVSGKHHGFAQCGFESLAVSWLFPDEVVSVGGACLDCAEATHITMRDGDVLEAEPSTIVAFVDVPFPNWTDYPLGFT